MIGYKLARPDGWDYYTGHTIQYRSPDGKYPHRVVVPRANAALGVCSEGVGHASNKPNDCFVGARIPCSAYRIEAQRVCGTDAKWGWLEADVLEEITDLGKLFGWRYSEAVAPVNPLALPRREPDAGDLEHLCVWASVWDSVRDSVWDSVRDSVRDSVWASVRDSVWASVWASVWDSVRDSVWASVGDSVRDSVGAYIGHLFPAIKEWKGAPLVQGYPFQSAVDLWMRGLVPSYDGKLWRLHSGPKAEIVL